MAKFVELINVGYYRYKSTLVCWVGSLGKIIAPAVGALYVCLFYGLLWLAWCLLRNTVCAENIIHSPQVMHAASCGLFVERKSMGQPA